MSPPFASVTVVSFKPVLGLLLAVTAGYGYLSMTVGREACRPVVDCSIDSSVCSAPKVCGTDYKLHTPGVTSGRPTGLDDSGIAADTSLKMLEYLQQRLPVYLAQGSHLGSLRNASMIGSDGDVDVLIAPRYGADGSSECTSKPSLATQWWWGSVKDQVAAVIKRDMPEGWILYEDTSAYDLQLSLKPLPGEPLRCCRWPHSIDINIESHCRQLERIRTFGSGWCQCWINSVSSRCVQDGRLFAECMYGASWEIPKTCTFSEDHPSKSHCTMDDRRPECDHLSYFECPAVISYKYRHLHGGGD